jgi:cytochrome c-type biogenesis protein CcmH
MTIFWILAAGLAGLAVLFVIAPLLQAPKPTARSSDVDGDAEPDQQQLNLDLFKQQLAELDADLASGKLDQTVYEAARRDLERELLHDLGDRDPLTGASSQAPTLAGRRLPGSRATALGLLLVVPLAAWALYAMIGHQAIIPQLERSAGTASGQRGGEQLPPLGELVARLEQRLEQQPDDAEGWMMLGRTYFATGNRKGAQDALARAYELDPTEPMIVLAYAEAIATNNDNQLLGRPAELISEALELAPENTTARWLAAMVAFQRGQFRSAATTWQRLLDGMDPSSDEAEELRALIAEAEQRAGLPPEAKQVAQNETEPSSATPAPANGDPAAAGAGTSNAAAGEDSSERTERADTASSASTATATAADAAADTGALRVRAAIDPGLANRYPPQTSVFIFARAASGPPMPLAVQRATLGDLPREVRLDDSMAMMPGMQLSNFPEVMIGARVSPSGQAMPRPGDLEGETGPVSSTRDAPVEVVIDRVRR